jgi:hypothetical protein
LGVKNRLIVFINWIYNYITYDQSLRLIFNEFYRPRVKQEQVAKLVENPSANPSAAPAPPSVPSAAPQQNLTQAADFKR